MVEDHGSNNEESQQQTSLFVSSFANNMNSWATQLCYSACANSQGKKKFLFLKIIQRLCFFKATNHCDHVATLNYTTLTIINAIIWCSTGRRIVIILSSSWYHDAVIISCKEKEALIVVLCSTNKWSRYCYHYQGDYVFMERNGGGSIV